MTRKYFKSTGRLSTSNENIQSLVAQSRSGMLLVADPLDPIKRHFSVIDVGLVSFACGGGLSEQLRTKMMTRRFEVEILNLC